MLVNFNSIASSFTGLSYDFNWHPVKSLQKKTIFVLKVLHCQIAHENYIEAMRLDIENHYKPHLIHITIKSEIP